MNVKESESPPGQCATQRRRWAGIAAFVIAFAAAGFVRAADRVWIGGNANWDENVGNWTFLDEPDPDDVAIFNTTNSVNLALDNSVMGLTLSGGIDLNTSGFDLDVDGLVQLSGASTILIVGGSDSLLSADAVTINSGSILRLTGGAVAVNEESGSGLFDMNSGGTLSGNGMIHLTDAVASGLVLFINDGTITAASTTPGDLLGLSAATLTINATDADARMDLDGIGEAGEVNVGLNDTLEINLPLADIFNGTISLGQNSTIRMNAPWQAGSGSAINANTVSILTPNTPGPAATIAGAAFTLSGGVMDLDPMDSLRFSAPFTANSGTISNAGHVIFNTNCTITAGANLLMIGEVASITVNTNAVVSIADPDFDLDGGAFPGNNVTIHSGGVLDLDLGAGADEALSGTIHINGGELDVTTLDNGWTINGMVHIGTNTGVSQINGEPVSISGTVSVGPDSTLDMNAPCVWAATGNLVLNAGTYRSPGAADFGGMMNVGSTGDSTLQAGSVFTFGSGSQTTLNGNLRLDNPTTIMQPGAAFTGGGALINRPARTLRLLDGVVSGGLNVPIQNDGVLQLGAPNTDAQIGGAAFQQAASGALQIEIGGTALNAFDRFDLTGAASLAGELDLALIGGFVPALGQAFNILTASAVSGTFTKVSQPAGMPAGTAFSVSYSPIAVQLTVTTPYEAWINSFTSLTAAADKLKTADPDNDGRNNLVEFALDGDPTDVLATGRIVVKVAPVSGVDALTLTFPVRAGAMLDAADPAGGALVLEHIGDAVSYSVEASEDLMNPGWTLDVTEVIGADAAGIQAGLPALNAGWVYRTFRSPGPVAGDPEEFMRVVVGD